MGNFIKQFFDIKFWKFILVGILNTVVGMGLQSRQYFKLFSQQILHIQKQGQGLEANR